MAEFLANKAAERAPKTHEWYRDSLMQLRTFLEARGLTRSGQFDEHAVNMFRVHLRERRVAENTVSNRLRAIKAFVRWMAERGWTEGNVLKDLQVPQSTRPTAGLASSSPTTYSAPSTTAVGRPITPTPINTAAIGTPTSARRPSPKVCGGCRRPSSTTRADAHGARVTAATPGMAVATN
ncbi:MAG: phage integrase SAM-like domain-containing protein [Chloroflexota bacterium]